MLNSNRSHAERAALSCNAGSILIEGWFSKTLDCGTQPDYDYPQSQLPDMKPNFIFDTLTQREK